MNAEFKWSRASQASQPSQPSQASQADQASQASQPNQASQASEARGASRPAAAAPPHQLSVHDGPSARAASERSTDPYNTSGSFDRTKNWARVGKR